MTSIKEEEFEIIEIEGVNIKELPEAFVHWYFDETLSARKVTDAYKKQGIQEERERERIKDKWITFINNIPVEERNFRPLHSAGSIRDDFLKIIEEKK
jgi:hypothetical protein